MNDSDSKLFQIIEQTQRWRDNWSPTTCPLRELQNHVAQLEEVEEAISGLAGRANYLRGILAARVLNEFQP